MADSAEDAPLSRGSLAGSEEVLVASASPAGGSNQRAFKVAALTTIACLLLASQVFTAFMVFDQKQQIHSLQKDSNRLGKQLTRASQAPVRMQMPMRSLPLLTDFTSIDDDKKPLTKLHDTVVSLETQVKNLMQGSQLPQFNETFLANLQSLKQHVNESEWTSFESWMRYWLIFQMAQQNPPTPTPQSAAMIKTKCQLEGESGVTKIGSYKPQCDEQGRYRPVQCWHATGFCWCVDPTGKAIPGTSVRGHPDCQSGYPSRRMLAPMRIQKTLSVDDE